jgi:hypothetical protein
MTPPAETPNSDTLFSIELTNGAQSIKDLYFKEGRGSVFTYRKTRIPLQLTVVFIIISGLFYFLSLSSDRVPYVFIFTIASLSGIALLIRFLLNAGKYYKWKKAVKAMIKATASFKKVSLNVKASGFEAIYDDQVVIEKWVNFKRATISPTHIYLVQKEADYLFPANSMQESEYEALSQIVRSKIANEDADDMKAKQS